MFVRLVASQICIIIKVVAVVIILCFLIIALLVLSALVFLCMHYDKCVLFTSIGFSCVPLLLLSPCLSLFVLQLVVALLIQYYRIRGQFTSALLWFYWCLWCLGSAVPLYSLVVRIVNVSHSDVHVYDVSTCI